MARKKANVIKMERQKRYGVAEARLKQLNREAHARVRSTVAIEIYRDVTGKPIRDEKTKKIIWSDVPVTINSSINNMRRVMYGLGEIETTTPREEVLQKIKDVSKFATCLFSIDTRAMYLIFDRKKNGYYFLYRERGVYYKKSLLYANMKVAMDRYDHDKVIWMKVVQE